MIQAIYNHFFDGGQDNRTSPLIVDFKTFFYFTCAISVHMKYHHIMLYIVIKLQIITNISKKYIFYF